MSMSSKNVAEMSFEEAFAELNGVVVSLEEAGLALEESIGLYERGQALARHCAAMLEKAELRVRQLNGEVFEDEV